MVETPPASLAAVMVVWPGWSAVMTPASSMVATLSSEEVQRTVLSAASSGRTVARRVRFTALLESIFQGMVL